MRLFGRRSAEGPPILYSLIWLVYLVFPLVALFQLPFLDMLGGLAAVLVFTALYVSGFMFEGIRIYAVLGLILIVMLFCVLIDASGIYMAFYPSAIIGQLRTSRQMTLGYVGLLSLFAFNIVHWKIFEDLSTFVQLLPAMVVMLFMPVGFRLTKRSRELRQKLNLANEEIARLSKNEERQRISRDLHDTLGHTLSLITLKSELAEKLIAKDPERAVQEVKDIQATSRAALKQVRELVSGMNAVTVRLELDHAKQILAAAGIVLEQRGDFDGVIPSPLIDNILGMCLRESVTNVVKHSRASVCRVELEQEPGSLRLTVADDGIGLQRKDELAAGGSGNGMKGMGERLKLIEGVLDVQSAQPNEGTRIVFTVPLVDKATGGG